MAIRTATTKLRGGIVQWFGSLFLAIAKSRVFVLLVALVSVGCSVLLWRWFCCASDCVATGWLGCLPSPLGLSCCISWRRWPRSKRGIGRRKVTIGMIIWVHVRCRKIIKLSHLTHCIILSIHFKLFQFKAVKYKWKYKSYRMVRSTCVWHSSRFMEFGWHWLVHIHLSSLFVASMRRFLDERERGRRRRWRTNRFR